MRPLTSPTCPAAQSLPPEVEMKARAVPGVEEAKVTVVWDPPWTQEKMTEAARLQLGLMCSGHVFARAFAAWCPKGDTYRSFDLPHVPRDLHHSILRPGCL